MPDYVHMHHSDVDACAEAPEEAFEAVWAEKGWELVDTHEGQTVLTYELDPPTDPDEENE